MASFSLTTLVLLFTLYALYYISTDTLKAFPGPLFARLTNLWRMYLSSLGQAHLVNRKLHDKFGPAVRMGPNMISLSDVELIKTVYANDEQYRKSDFYTANDVAAKPTPIETLFGTRNSAYHQRLIRPIQRLYSINQMDEFEPLMNVAIDSFMKLVREEILKNQGKQWTCEIEELVKFFTWDAMSQVTFSRPMGFLEKFSDIGNLILNSRGVVEYLSIIGNVPWLDKILDKNPIHRIGPPSMSHAAAFSMEQITHRVSEKNTDEQRHGQKDFLDHFLYLKREHPETINDQVVMLYILSNVVAGSDTVATAVNAIFNFTMRSPRVYKKLMEEMDSINAEQSTHYKELRKLPYLTAVIAESMRLFPPVGFPLERIVPQGGLKLPDGRIVPQGTIVAMNAWVLHHQPVFGHDTDTFRPERWLKGDDENEEMSSERIKQMRAATFVFGYGRRVCIGKELALMEIYLLVVRVLKSFELSIPHPEREWKVLNRFFVFQEGTVVSFKPPNIEHSAEEKRNVVAESSEKISTISS